MLKTTKSLKPAEVKKDWILIDADGVVLSLTSPSSSPTGCAASNRPQFTPHVDGGDNVIVVNAEIGEDHRQ